MKYIPGKRLNIFQKIKITPYIGLKAKYTYKDSALKRYIFRILREQLIRCSSIDRINIIDSNETILIRIYLTQ